MGVDYYAYLYVGFKCSLAQVLEPLKRTHTTVDEGEFHMEDRINSKTKALIGTVKVWDREPLSTTDEWYDVAGKRLEMDSDIEDDICFALEEVLKCKIDYHPDDSWGDDHDDGNIIFYVNGKTSKEVGGRFHIMNNPISLSEMNKMNADAELLKTNLDRLGIKVGEPEVFIYGDVSY